MTNIVNSELCTDQAGLVTVFVTDASNIDWEAMALATNYTDAIYTIDQWVMEAGGLWGELTFNAEQGRLDALYTVENGYYEINLQNLIFAGRQAAKSIALDNLIACCGLVAQIHSNDGKARMVGREFVSGAWVPSLRQIRVSRNLDTTGAFGDEEDKGRNEVDMAGRHRYAPAYSDVTIAEMRTMLVT